MLNSLFKKKQHEDGMKENLNSKAWNLTSRTSNEERKALSYGLNHGLATYQKEVIFWHLLNQFGIKFLEITFVKNHTTI